MDFIGILVFIALVFLLLFFATFFLRLGASVAGVPKHKNTFGRALLILFISWLVIGLLGGAGSFVPGFGNVLGVIIGAGINMLIIGAIFDVPFPKAFITYIFSLIFQVVFVFIAVFIMGLIGISLGAMAH